MHFLRTKTGGNHLTDLTMMTIRMTELPMNFLDLQLVSLKNSKNWTIQEFLGESPNVLSHRCSVPNKKDTKRKEKRVYNLNSLLTTYRDNLPYPTLLLYANVIICSVAILLSMIMQYIQHNIDIGRFGRDMKFLTDIRQKPPPR